MADATEAITATLAFGRNAHDSNEKASSEGNSDEAFSELPRLDLNQNQLIQSHADDRLECLQIKAFRPSSEPACTNACTNLTGNAASKRTEGVGRKGSKRKPKAAATTSANDPQLGALSNPQTSAPLDFLAAVTGIMALPLTDAEKAEAIRRLLGSIKA